MDVLNVVCIDHEVTGSALAAAASLSKDLGMTLRLLILQVVPYRLPIAEPQVSPMVLLHRMRRKLAELPHGDAVLHCVLCRDREEAIVRCLCDHSLVLIGSRQWPFTGKAAQLAERLEKEGHEVILISDSGKSTRTKWRISLGSLVSRGGTRGS